MEKGKRLPTLSHNLVSGLGALVSLVSFFAILFLISVNIFIGIKNPYVGIILYMALPACLIVGLLLIPAGMYARWRYWQKKGELPYRKWPSLDLNDTQSRNAFMVFLAGTFLFFLISAVGMYQAYQYTDSVAFCGKTCHTVMKPEYTTHETSPHARVKCADCHIGPGVGWYTKSKLSGLYQVYAVLADVYRRPIPTPVSSLRPARVTCEQCHWPGQFFGAMQRRFDHYMYDKENSLWPVNLLLKVGSGNPMISRTAGIHWHVDPDIAVEYIARDKRRQDIPWVRVTDSHSGEVRIFQDESSPLSPKEISSAVPRVMDCMDCHNRPSHNFQSPDREIDQQLRLGEIDPSLPDVKRAAVQAMAANYRTDAGAIKGIETSLDDFYRKTYPSVYSSRRDTIEKAIRATQQAFGENVFPVMKSRWSVYPNDIGHFIFPGCMRCHDGGHKDKGGRSIPHDCHTCHIIMEQGKTGPTETLDLDRGLDFQHPLNIGSAWKKTGCYECHKGVQP
jgi:nitrate/TMAO reductase-like tetraheme cytochrome c subunit